MRKFRTVQREGPRDVEQVVDHYNLDRILGVGYWV
ncbi:MAG: virulence RhuM family protein [Deltaproteobacteria bacterium]|nr:virulence RhuM family protein [Deltaproteobacteria bacterium]